MEKEITKLIEERGPMTGAELRDAVSNDPLLLWQTCMRSQHLKIMTVGTKYLRLDRRINGFARMSPSILREFLTYSAIGFALDQPSLIQKAHRILSHIEDVSRAKAELAYDIVSTLVNRIIGEHLINEHVCFIIAGDIVFNMAHDVPRPERSTGRLVKGSDMDMVVITDDSFPKKLVKRLDEEIFKEKYSLLINPHLREEIDYIVKNLSRVREQVKFDTFKHMVACKILQEGTLLFGSEGIFHTVKKMLKDHRVTEKLNTMEEKAITFRKESEQILLRECSDKIGDECLSLFYPTEESEEFE